MTDEERQRLRAAAVRVRECLTVARADNPSLDGWHGRMAHWDVEALTAFAEGELRDCGCAEECLLCAYARTRV